MTPTPTTIGRFVDEIAGKTRTPAAVAGRALEEMVELASAAGLSASEILAHVSDSLHNQALKASSATGKTVFPSQVQGNPAEMAEECADVRILIKDLCYVAGIDPDPVEASKWNAFTKKQFRITPKGTIYAVKPHSRYGRHMSVATI